MADRCMLVYEIFPGRNSLPACSMGLSKEWHGEALDKVPFGSFHERIIKYRELEVWTR
jgi:hypothetical protein